MKTKIFYVLLLILLIISQNIDAQPTNDEKIEKIVKNCYNCLIHDNQGVVESALFVSIQFRNKFPNENTRVFIEALKELAEKSQNPRISYKAQLAKIYFKNTELFKNVEIKSIKEEKQVFEQIAKTLNNVILATEF